MSHSHGESSASPNQLKRYDNKLGVVHLPKFLFLRDAVDSVQDTLNFSWAVKDRGWEQFNDSTDQSQRINFNVSYFSYAKIF
mmetsp:Transcript_1358/g.2766  ORF Transcript_1358/g.2766 Transcript_1358/m.2766 type:complete len:82 (+) Transcript_1358:203-448(+)